MTNPNDPGYVYDPDNEDLDGLVHLVEEIASLISARLYYMTVELGSTGNTTAGFYERRLELVLPDGTMATVAEVNGVANDDDSEGDVDIWVPATEESITVDTSGYRYVTNEVLLAVANGAYRLLADKAA